MNTTKKTLLAVLTAVSLLFATSAFAGGKNCDRDSKNGYSKKCGNGEYKKYKNCKTGKNYHKGNKSRFIIGAVYSLELTKDQETKINGFVKDFQDNRSDTMSAFKEDSFDKEAFIKTRTNKKENMIKAKADLIENIYSVLTKDQKAQLKQKLDNNFKKMKGSRG